MARPQNWNILSLSCRIGGVQCAGRQFPVNRLAPRRAIRAVRSAQSANAGVAITAAGNAEIAPMSARYRRDLSKY